MDKYRPMDDQDAADSPLSSYWVDTASKMSEQEAAEFLSLVEHYDKELEGYVMLGMAEGLGYVLRKIWSRDNRELAIKAFSIAAGFTSMATETLEEVADDLGITKQAVDKEVTYFRDWCGFRPLGSAKPEEARESCKRAQLAREPQQENKYGTFEQFYQFHHQQGTCAI